MNSPATEVVTTNKQRQKMSPGGVCNSVPNWTPRFWHSMRLADFHALLAEGRFRITRSRWIMVLLLLPVAVGNSLLSILQKLFYGSRIPRASVKQPVFIVGHFRSGTTHLYELLARDKNFIYPTMYECFAPNHFLLTGGWLPKLLGFLLPSRRPMDNMALGFDRPQEDEFAMIGLGAPTLYRRMAFPNEPIPELVQPDTSTSRGKQLRAALDQFYRALSIKKKGRLLLKSPLHTGRIAQLLEMYPDAKFLHIVRNPEKMFPSLKHTWKVLDQSQAFQVPVADLDYEELVFDTFNALYDRFRRDVIHLSSDTICEVRYEELMQNPINELQRVYQALNLGDFQQAKPAIENYLQSLQGYVGNQFEIDQPTQQKIARRWRWYYEQYDYPLPATTEASS